MVTTTSQMLKNAQQGGYAVGAFNIENMEMAQAVLEAAVQMRAPVIVQVTPGTVKYGSLPLFAATVTALAQHVDVPVAIHLDHGNSYDLACQAMQAGFTSVMIDGSLCPYEENIRLTASVAAVAGAKGIPVEAELGTVGGKEDGHGGGGDGLTDPDLVADFVQRTGANSLAVAIGTAHGIYQGVPRLDIERLRTIRGRVQVPLVLHGASGIPDADVKACIAHGICKVNFATELRIAYSDGVKGCLRQDAGVYDPKQYGAAGREFVRRAVTAKMQVCGCCDRA